MNIKKIQIAVIGLGYVGLPLAFELSKKFNTFGFDISKRRIKKLTSGIDENLEFTKKQLKKTKLKIVKRKSEISKCNFYIITVPTPINKEKKPDLKSLISASKFVASILNINDIVVYESTVYPGLTEEICVPILQDGSSLELITDAKIKSKSGFYVGYSPERINPGDKKYNITNIMKVIASSSHKSTNFIEKIYSKIIKAGTFKAKSIRVAEAAKVIENIQRDVNIALINELKQLFDKLNINTNDVLEASRTKWNFLDFKPGLVGGHCIGVDPYYLTYKAKTNNFKPNIILAGRKTNDEMSKYYAKSMLKELKAKNINIKKSKILIMGYTFKENCPDIRNSQVKNLAEFLSKKVHTINIYDPWIRGEVKFLNKNIKHIKKLSKNIYDSVLVAVAHDIFKFNSVDKLKKLTKENHIIMDIKNIYNIKTKN